MANDRKYLSAEEEAKLLKPIDEYVGKIQAQIDALRVDGSDKVQALKTHISLTKEEKIITIRLQQAVQLKRKLRMQNMKRFAQISKQSTSAQFPA